MATTSGALGLMSVTLFCFPSSLMTGSPVELSARGQYGSRQLGVEAIMAGRPASVGYTFVLCGKPHDWHP